MISVTLKLLQFGDSEIMWVKICELLKLMNSALWQRMLCPIFHYYFSMLVENALSNFSYCAALCRVVQRCAALCSVVQRCAALCSVVCKFVHIFASAYACVGVSCLIWS